MATEKIRIVFDALDEKGSIIGGAKQTIIEIDPADISRDHASELAAVNESEGWRERMKEITESRDRVTPVIEAASIMIRLELHRRLRAYYAT